MRYHITFYDRSELKVDEKQGIILNDLIMKDATSKTPFQVNGDMYRISDIRTIKHELEVEEILNIFKPGNASEKELAGKKCQGQQSIQWAIHEYAKRTHKTGWGPLVKNPKYREEIRKMLIEENPDKKWCDYKVNECACV